MQNKQEIQEAIEVLNDARNKVSPLLKSIPALQLRSNNALDTLIGGLAHTIQGQVPAQIAINSEPLTHVLGQKVLRENKKVGPATVKVSDDDVEELRARIADAYPTFRDRDNKSLQEALTDIEIRGIAKMAGMEVTETDPKKITLPFIDKIKAAITKKEEQEAAEEEAAAAAAAKTNED